MSPADEMVIAFGLIPLDRFSLAILTVAYFQHDKMERVMAKNLQSGMIKGTEVATTIARRFG